MWKIFKRKEKMSVEEKNQKEAKKLVFDLNEIVAAHREGSYKTKGYKSIGEAFNTIKSTDYPFQVLKYAMDFAIAQKEHYKRAGMQNMTYEDFVIYNEIIEDYEKTLQIIKTILKFKYPEQYKNFNDDENMFDK